jgi:hypothetical protein
MPVTTTLELDRGIQILLKLLEEAKEQMPPTFDQARLESIKAELEELRLESLAEEVRAKYPDAKISRRLLRLVGIDEDIPIEKEMELFSQILEERYGYSGAV